MEKRAKHVYESKTTQIQILMPRHINGYNRLFGGKLVEWIDVVAAVTARRHSGCNVTTASIDNLQFQSGAYANSTIVIEGQLTWVGRTSMEVPGRHFCRGIGWKENPYQSGVSDYGCTGRKRESNPGAGPSMRH